MHKSKADVSYVNLHMDLDRSVILAARPACLLVYGHDSLIAFTFQHSLQLVHQFYGFLPLTLTFRRLSFLVFQFFLEILKSQLKTLLDFNFCFMHYLPRIFDEPYKPNEAV